jgi:hypothetical protein
LRRLAATARDRVEATLQRAFQESLPSSTRKSTDLLKLVAGADLTMPERMTADQRGRAFWRLIRDEVQRIELDEERMALTAALHLDADNRETNIDKRLVYARDKGRFGTPPSGGQHGYDTLRRWWGSGVRLLGWKIHERLEFLDEQPARWQEYFTDAARVTYRAPSRGAQPVFAELFLTTVFMKGRFVHRRITERLIIAKADNVAFYTARALPEMSDPSYSVPVRALWGCRAELLPARPGEPILTRLRFPRPLRTGQRHFFSSEATTSDVSTERRAINVEVDHYGIAPGLRRKSLPVSGLTIRIRFDPDELPDGVWFYSDVAERERYDRPAAGDDRWITVTPLGEAEHTFSEACQPLANYGLSIAWRNA